MTQEQVCPPSSILRDPVIIVHGGCLPCRGNPEVYRKDIQQVAIEGYKTLMGGGSALDAVEKAICCLEDNPTFNAGKGSALNAAGEIEMDAIIMDGGSLMSGAVSGVRDIKNPIKLARCVMEKTNHHFLIGKGLEVFIDEMALPRIDPLQLGTEERAKQFRDWQESGHQTSQVDKLEEDTGHDTVGAVALDATGNIACATSTGGLLGRRVGRLGDSPLIGCGAYCDSAVGGVSTTGIGEAIMKIAMASRIIIYMEQGLSGQEAASKTFDILRARTLDEAGVIVLSADGEAIPVFNSPAMPWAKITKGHLSHGVLTGECLDGGHVSLNDYFWGH